jgi:ketosteroid isomerase-like protein
MSELSERQRENLELTRRGFDAFNAGDTDAIPVFNHEEVEVYIPPRQGVGSGTYRGHEGYLRWYLQWMESFDEYSAEPVKMEPVGDRHVVVLAHQTATGAGSGVPVETDFANMVEIRDGRTVALHIYPTYAEAVKVAKRREWGEPDAKG